MRRLFRGLFDPLGAFWRGRIPAYLENKNARFLMGFCLLSCGIWSSSQHVPEGRVALLIERKNGQLPHQQTQPALILLILMLLLLHLLLLLLLVAVRQL